MSLSPDFLLRCSHVRLQDLVPPGPAIVTDVSLSWQLSAGVWAHPSSASACGIRLQKRQQLLGRDWLMGRDHWWKVDQLLSKQELIRSDFTELRMAD